MSPAEFGSGAHIPEEVFEAFNELITEKRGHVMQDDVVDRILSKMPDVTRDQLFERGWLDVEEAYRRKGWTVEYDKPGFNESYRASFTFAPRRSP